MKRLFALFLMRCRLVSMRRDRDAHAEAAENYTDAARAHRGAVARIDREMDRIELEISAMEADRA